MKKLYFLIAFAGAVILSSSKLDDCNILKNNAFKYKVGSKDVLVQFGEDEYIEYHENKKYFIKSEFYRKQKNVGDAINELVYLIKNYPESKIVSLAILRLSLFHHKVGEYKESLKYSSLLKNTEFEDQGIILSGQIFQYNLNEPDKALSNYMRIINEFPQSIFFEPIRFHVREMRKGKNI